MWARWVDLNQQLDALTAATAPAHRASLAQGGALLGLARHWLRHDVPLARPVRVLMAQAAERSVRCHGAVVLGVLSLALNLPRECLLDVIVHSTVRDCLAAAIRLNLVGPLRAVGMQAEISAALIDSQHDFFDSMSTDVAVWVEHAAGTAPLIETAHMCHDMLDLRLFQS